MIDIKKIHPGITYLNNLPNLLSDQINLASESDIFSPDKQLIKAALKAFGENNNHCPLNGLYALREKISQFIQQEYTYVYNPEDEITITPGTSQAIATAISTFIHEGDEVILFEPAYYSYDSLVMANGGRPIYVQRKHPDFQVDWDEVQKGITGRTKMIIINSPNYSSGSILSVADMDKLAKIVNGTKIIILSDESFGQVVFEGYEHQSIARFPKLASRSLIVSSFGKSLQIDGWEIGYCLAPAKISADFRKMQHLQTFSVNTPLQIAISEYLREHNFNDDVAKQLQSKRDILVKGLKKSKFTLSPAKGSYFQILNYIAISDDKDVEFCNYLFESKKIAVMPLSFFYHDLFDQKCIRLCFANSDETLHKTVEILNQL